jgi:hypothetical protein
MPMTRSGLSSLMGYAPGGVVDLADIEDANEIINSESFNEVSSDIGDQSAGIAGLLTSYKKKLMKPTEKISSPET